MRMADSFSGALGCSCSAEFSKKNTYPIILGNTATNLVKLVTTTLAILKQYFGNTLLFIKNIFCMFKCLSAGKYIRITMKGWKYDTIRTRTRLLQSADQTNVMAEWGKRNNFTKVEGGGVSVNTYYFTILFRRCFATVVNQL